MAPEMHTVSSIVLCKRAGDLDDSSCARGAVRWTQRAAVLLATALVGCAGTQAMAIDSAASGDWHVGATWVGVTAPTAGADVNILNGHTVTVNEVLTTYSVDNLTVENGGVLTHAANNASEQYKILFNVAENLTVDSGGAIDVSEKGYDNGNGPSASSGRGAAGHGGEGSLGFSASFRGNVYGSLTNPVNLGSSSDYQKHEGGGAIIITVGGALTNNGSIKADGESALPISDNGAGAAGGTVNLRAATIAGSGSITANGGDSDSNAAGGGGGGRIAIVLTQGGADFSSYSGSTTAYGGALGNPASQNSEEDGAAGTVYLKAADQTYGDLIIDNNGLNTTAAVTLFTNATHRFDNIMTTNEGALAPGANSVLDLTGTALHSDSIISGNPTNTITSRIIVGRSNGSIRWPADYAVTGTLSWEGTNASTGITNLTIASGGILTHEAGSSAEANWLNLSIVGYLTIDLGGAIDVSLQGHTAGNGDGTPSGGRGGAGHGGEGGDGHATSTRGSTYGSITNPRRYGTSTTWNRTRNGGGVVKLTVSGGLTNNGVIIADGQSAAPGLGDGGAGASGGSINLVAATLSGSGDINANGGTSDRNASGGGGGGRVAILLTQAGATFAAFGATNITAFGGPMGLGGGACCGEEPGAAGTVYLQTGSQAEGAGTVTIDNDGESTQASTDILPVADFTVGELTAATVILSNGGDVASTTNVTIGNILILTDSSWTLSTFTVSVNADEHALDNLSDPTPNSTTNRVDNYDQLIWLGDGAVPAGTTLFFK